MRPRSRRGALPREDAAIFLARVCDQDEIVFHYAATRQHRHVETFLNGFKGTLRWSWFVGQSKGKLKVYSDWFLALDERTLPMARDDVKGIVGSSVGALVKCRSVMTGSTLPVMINHFATAVAVSPEGPERSGGAA